MSSWISLAAFTCSVDVVNSARHPRNQIASAKTATATMTTSTVIHKYPNLTRLVTRHLATELEPHRPPLHKPLSSP